jgi:hypothetical protein
MPASSAPIGCNIAILRVKVTGLAPCLLVRSQKHPVYSTVLRHRIHRSTSFGTSVSLVKLILENHRARWTCGPYRPMDGTRPARMPAVCPFGLA